jgi:hypothetical protein
MERHSTNVSLGLLTVLGAGSANILRTWCLLALTGLP